MNRSPICIEFWAKRLHLIPQKILLAETVQIGGFIDFLFFFLIF